MATPLGERLRRQLEAIPELAALATTEHRTLLPKRLTTSGRTVPGSRPPANLATLDLLDERRKTNGGRHNLDQLAHIATLDAAAGRREGTLPCLESWVRLADAEMWDAGHDHIGPSDEPTISTEAGWLALNLDWISEQPWLDELAQDIHRLHRDLERAIGEYRPEYRPTCTCGTRMDDHGSVFHCPGCGNNHGSTTLGLRELVVHEKPMTTGQLSKAFGWPINTINGWIRRGQLQPANDTTPARYHALDALRLADTGGTTA